MKSYSHRSTMVSKSLKYPIWKGQISPQETNVQPSLTLRPMLELLQPLLYAIHMLPGMMIHLIVDTHPNIHTHTLLHTHTYTLRKLSPVNLFFLNNNPLPCEDPRWMFPSKSSSAPLRKVLRLLWLAGERGDKGCNTRMCLVCDYNVWQLRSFVKAQGHRLQLTFLTEPGSG